MDRDNIEIRRGLILEMISRDPYISQKEILHRLKEHGLGTVQSTISRDIDALDFERMNGKYQKKEDVAARERRLLLEGLFRSRSPRVRLLKNVYMVSVNCHLGMEGAVAGLLYDLWGANVTGVFPGLGCVMVMTNNIKNARVLEKTLRGYSRGQSKYVLLEGEGEGAEDSPAEQQQEDGD